MWRFIYLLVFPILRGFLAALQGGMSEWFNGAWFDIFTLIVIITLAFLEWMCMTISFDREVIEVRRGIFFRQYSRIELQKVCVAYIRQPFYLKPLRAVHIVMDTLAGNSSEVDFKMTVSRKLADKIISTQKLKRFNSETTRVYKPKTINIVLLSVMISNSLAGILFLSTFISQSGRILSNTIIERIRGTFQYVAQKLAFGIPPAAAALAYILLFGWLCSVLLNMIRYQNFTVGRSKNTMLISGGIITNRDYIIDMNCINYVDIRQTLMSKIFGIYSVFVNAVGFGKRKDDLAAVMPASTRGELNRYMTEIMPEYRVSRRQIKHNAGAIFKFILDPIWACVLIPAVTALICIAFTEWKDVALFVGIMMMIPAVWFLAIRLVDYCTSGIAFDGEYYTLRYSSGMYLHTVIIPKDKVAYVDLRQSIIQKMDQKCDIKLRTVYETKKIHHIRNVDRQNVIDLCGFDLGCWDETITPIKKR